MPRTTLRRLRQPPRAYLGADMISDLRCSGHAGVPRVFDAGQEALLRAPARDSNLPGQSWMDTMRQRFVNLNRTGWWQWSPQAGMTRSAFKRSNNSKNEAGVGW